MMNKVIFMKATSYCAKGEHCTSEVEAKLRGWGAEQNEKEEIMTFLYDHNYINDSRFARAFAHDKLVHQGWGRVKIRILLLQKHLPGEIIQEALASLDEQEYEQKLRDIAEKKRQLLQKTGGDDERDKLIRFLISRGFSYDEIDKIVD